MTVVAHVRLKVTVSEPSSNLCRLILTAKSSRMQHNERGGNGRVPCGMQCVAEGSQKRKSCCLLPTAIFGHFGIVVWAISLPYALFVCLASAVNTANTHTHTHINPHRAWEQKKSCCCNGCNISFAYAKWQQKRQRQRQPTHDDIADKREKTMQTNTLTGVD